MGLKLHHEYCHACTFACYKCGKTTIRLMSVLISSMCEAEQIVLIIRSISEVLCSPHSNVLFYFTFLSDVLMLTKFFDDLQINIFVK